MSCATGKKPVTQSEKTPLQAILIGEVAPLGDRNASSGIAKHPVRDPLWLGENGFVGDNQADTKNHGGPEKAVHHYPRDHYAAWYEEMGAHPLLAVPGAFGENLSTYGLDEETVALGDVFRLGKAVVEVSQGRQPCWKLNSRFGVSTMAYRVQTTGRTGWYYRVVQEGRVSPDDHLERLERPMPEWPLKRLWQILYVKTLDRGELEEMAALEKLPEGWRRYAQRRLASGKVEDWNRRLKGAEQD
ncbi:MOSC domain-containing protein [uncultured Nitratireductor sp.]|uniref:MOSC domain-containing protein n=1 Tax=uncultured Nitratireductor sp. TaxID=520953 RepID=UPI0025CE51AA|nr:MOSC domain-containing protein [uncultured Nitratireductor sp.]